MQQDKQDREKQEKIKYNAITHAQTDTQNYKHIHTPPHRYNHGEDLILITNKLVANTFLHLSQ